MATDMIIQFITLLKSLMKKRIITVLMLSAIIFIGFYLRFDNLDHWLNNKSQYFTSTNLPVTLGVDPYYYLDIADDLLHGKMESFDSHRNYPVGTHKPSSAPLLSVLLALFSFITKQPLEWIAILLPPFLGVLIAFPLYLLGQTLTINATIPLIGGKPITATEAKIFGFSAALFTLISPAYIVRSSIGWCDTDILNVTLATLCIYLATRFFCAKSGKNYLQFFILWLASFLIFMWWWDQTVTPILFLAGSPMLLAFLLSLNGIRKRSNLPVIILSTLILIAIVWKSGFFHNLPAQVSSLFSYISGSEKDSFFPALEKFVQEQEGYNLKKIGAGIAGNFYLHILSILGLLILFFISKKKFLFLFPLIAMHLLSLYAMRFQVFIAPLFGLGMGAIVLSILIALRKFNYIRIAVVLPIIFLSSTPAIHRAQGYNSAKPLLAPALYDGMQKIADLTPEDSVIWSSWGHGHPLVYYAKRSTISDGMYHPIFLDFVTKVPYATNNFRLSANWIQFYTVNGEAGLKKAFGILTGDRNDWPAGVISLKKLLRVGVDGSRKILATKYELTREDTESFLSFLFPTTCPPIYTFIDHMLIREQWYGMGKWDLTKKTSPKHTLIPVNYFNVTQNSVRGVTDSGGFDLYLPTGETILTGNNRLGVAGITIAHGNNIFKKDYPGRGKNHFVYLTQNERSNEMFGVITDFRVKDTVLIKLFFGKKSGQNFIKPVIADLPMYLICKVQGDKYTPEKTS